MPAQQPANSESSADEPEPSEILAPGPILALAGLAIGWGIHQFIPIGGFPSPANYAVGVVVGVVGIAILASGWRMMNRIGKSPDHRDEPTDLLTQGPFAYSRNPLYLGLIIAYLGLTIIIDSVWPILTLLPLLWYFDLMARREEAYLEAKFGDEFREYCEDVRRWL